MVFFSMSWKKLTESQLKLYCSKYRTTGNHPKINPQLNKIISWEVHKIKRQGHNWLCLPLFPYQMLWCYKLGEKPILLQRVDSPHFHIKNSTLSWNVKVGSCEADCKIFGKCQSFSVIFDTPYVVHQYPISKTSNRFWLSHKFPPWQ